MGQARDIATWNEVRVYGYAVTTRLAQTGLEFAADLLYVIVQTSEVGRSRCPTGGRRKCLSAVRPGCPAWPSSELHLSRSHRRRFGSLPCLEHREDRALIGHDPVCRLRRSRPRPIRTKRGCSRQFPAPSRREESSRRRRGLSPRRPLTPPLMTGTTTPQQHSSGRRAPPAAASTPPVIRQLA